MKKIVFAIIVAFISIGVNAQGSWAEKLSFATSIGTGISMSSPSHTPFSCQAMGYYYLNNRFSIGAGTGLSLYEKALIPVFVDVKFAILKLRKFTPYLECASGYSFAPDKEANGGFYLNPSVGVQYAMGGKKRLFFAVGYEMQKLERLKRQEQTLFTAEFAEKLSHKSVSIKMGFMF